VFAQSHPHLSSPDCLTFPKGHGGWFSWAWLALLRHASGSSAPILICFGEILAQMLVKVMVHFREEDRMSTTMLPEERLRICSKVDYMYPVPQANQKASGAEPPKAEPSANPWPVHNQGSCRTQIAAV